MWYSFLGTTLTVLLGLLISTITEKMIESKVMSIVEYNEKATRRASTIFSINEAYRRKSQIHQTPMHGIDNCALKIEE